MYGQDKPPKIMFTDRKYEPMGNVIMANVKARSLKMMLLNKNIEY